MRKWCILMWHWLSFLVCTIPKIWQSLVCWENVQLSRILRLNVIRLQTSFYVACCISVGVIPVVMKLVERRACRGKHLTLLVRFPNQGRQVEDIDLWSHTNETIGQLRRQLIARWLLMLCFWRAVMSCRNDEAVQFHLCNKQNYNTAHWALSYHLVFILP